MFFRRRPAADTAPPPEPPATEPEPAVVARELATEMAGLVARVNAAGGRLPPGAVPLVRAIDDVLRPLLQYVENRSASDQEMRQLTTIVREYLPTAVDDFLSLPQEYAYRAGVTGTTPADDLVRQLELLNTGVDDLQDAVYTGDAQQLAIQARFLDAKFRRSDLD